MNQRANDCLPELDLACINRALEEETTTSMWSAEVRDLVELWYRRFLFLCSQHRDRELVPTLAIDEFWHMHILHTKKYVTDCQRLFGAYFHHTPFGKNISPQDNNRRAQGFASTMQLFQEEFADNPTAALKRLDAPESLCGPGAASCSGNCGGEHAPSATQQQQMIASGNVLSH
jgi:hypothetical protein